ncbi:MAG: hypothetical protein J5J06_14005 [Phycisphaerae bacterium]|nr:hypothetical protein [Phycisphaerae bacterium]
MMNSNPQQFCLSRCLALMVLLAGAGPIANAQVSDSSNAEAQSDKEVDRILTSLEKASDDLRSIRCQVRFEEEDRVNLTVRKKIGNVQFLFTDDNPKFLVHFEKSEVDGIAGKQEWYLFDGRWLYQAVERLEQVTKQEYARPGETLDLFDLETAPFPLPFGQRKEAILKNFEVRLEVPAKGDPPNTDHLVCVPREESRLSREYDRLDFFVLRDIHLPVRIVANHKGGYETSRADFPDLSPASLNVGLSAKDFEPLKAWSKYKLVVEPLEPAGGPKNADGGR